MERPFDFDRASLHTEVVRNIRTLLSSPWIIGDTVPLDGLKRAYNQAYGDLDQHCAILGCALTSLIRSSLVDDVSLSNDDLTIFILPAFRRRALLQGQLAHAYGSSQQQLLRASQPFSPAATSFGSAFGSLTNGIPYSPCYPSYPLPPFIPSVAPPPYSPPLIMAPLAFPYQQMFIAFPQQVARLPQAFPQERSSFAGLSLDQFEQTKEKIRQTVIEILMKQKGGLPLLRLTARVSADIGFAVSSSNLESFLLQEMSDSVEYVDGYARFHRPPIVELPEAKDDGSTICDSQRKFNGFGTSNETETTIHEASESPDEVLPSSSESPSEAVPTSSESPDKALPPSAELPNEILPPTSDLPSEALLPSSGLPDEAVSPSLEPPDEAVSHSSEPPDKAVSPSSELPDEALPLSSDYPGEAVSLSSEFLDEALPLSSELPDKVVSAEPLDEALPSSSESPGEVLPPPSESPCEALPSSTATAFAVNYPEFAFISSPLEARSTITIKATAVSEPIPGLDENECEVGEDGELEEYAEFENPSLQIVPPLLPQCADPEPPVKPLSKESEMRWLQWSRSVEGFGKLQCLLKVLRYIDRRIGPFFTPEELNFLDIWPTLSALNVFDMADLVVTEFVSSGMPTHPSHFIVHEDIRNIQFLELEGPAGSLFDVLFTSGPAALRDLQTQMDWNENEEVLGGPGLWRVIDDPELPEMFVLDFVPKEEGIGGQMWVRLNRNLDYRAVLWWSRSVPHPEFSEAA